MKGKIFWGIKQVEQGKKGKEWWVRGKRPHYCRIVRSGIRVSFIEKVTVEERPGAGEEVT